MTLVHASFRCFATFFFLLAARVCCTVALAVAEVDIADRHPSANFGI